MIPNSAVKSLETQINDSPFSPAGFLKYRCMSFWDPSRLSTVSPSFIIRLPERAFGESSSFSYCQSSALRKVFFVKKKKGGGTILRNSTRK